MTDAPDAGPPEFSGGRTPPMAGGRLVIAGARIVTMTRPGVLEGHMVVIEDGRIADIVPDGTPIARATWLDTGGRYLLPGLADMHVHFSEPGEAALFLAHGVTTIRNMDGASFHLGYQRRVEAGELLGPRVLTTSPVIDGAASDGHASWPGRVPARTVADAEAVVDGYAERGYRSLKVYSLLTPDVLAAIGRRARRHGLSVTGHCPQGMSQEEAIAAGMTGFEHLDGLLANGRFDAGRTRALARRYVSEQIWNCPTMTQHQFLERPPDLARDLDWYRYSAPYARAFADFALNTFAAMGVLDGMREETAAGNRAYFEALALLLDEGAPVVAGTDTPVPLVTPGLSLHRELANMVRAGLSPLDALRTATSEPARCVGAAGQWGSVQKGARADLLLCPANPALDIAAVQDPDLVIVAGRPLDRAYLDRLLARRAQAVAGPPEPAGQPQLAGAPEPAGPPALVRRVGSCQEGRLSYTDSAEPDGHRTLVEREESPYASRTSRVRLDPDGCVVEADIRLRSVAGDEHCRLTRASSGHYRFDVTEYDGHRVQGTIELDVAALDPNLAVAATAHTVARAEGELPLIRFDRAYNTGIVLGRPVAATVRIRRAGAESAREWHVDDGSRDLVSWESWGLAPPSEFTEPPILRLDADGRVSALRGLGFFGLTSYGPEAGPVP